MTTAPPDESNKVNPVKLYECRPCKQAFLTRQQLTNHRRTVGHQRATHTDSNGLDSRKRKLDTVAEEDITAEDAEIADLADNRSTPNSSGSASPTLSIPDTQPIDISPIASPVPRKSRWAPVSGDTNSESVLKALTTPLTRQDRITDAADMQTVGVKHASTQTSKIQPPAMIPTVTPVSSQTSAIVTPGPTTVTSSACNPVSNAATTQITFHTPVVPPISVTNRPISASLPNLMASRLQRPSQDPRISNMATYPAHALIVYLCPTCCNVSKRPPLIAAPIRMSISIHTQCVQCTVQEYAMKARASAVQ